MNAKEEQNLHCPEGGVVCAHAGPQRKWERQDTFYFMMERDVRN